MTLHRMQLLLAAMALTVSPSLADDGTVLARWFDALRTTDREALAGLLADDARIVLNDMGVEQTREEFLGSLDAWEDATGSGTDIRYRVEEELDAETIVTVCYDFPSNSVLTSERFLIEGEKIRESNQTQIAESCDGL